MAAVGKLAVAEVLDRDIAVRGTELVEYLVAQHLACHHFAVDDDGVCVSGLVGIDQMGFSGRNPILTMFSSNLLSAASAGRMFIGGEPITVR